MQKVKSTIHIILGLFLILLGIAGLILPILNGMIFLLLGFILISFESKYVEYHLNKFAHKNAFSGKWYDKLLSFMNKLFSR